jgi:ATP-dependent DNA helicase RecQ
MLDQFDVLTMVSDYKSSLGVQFILSHNALIDLIDTTKNKAKADFIDQLFRLYGPESQHEMIFLEEGYLCDKLGKSYNQIVKGMEILHNELIIKYEVRKGNPLVNLHESRYSKLPYSARIVEQYRNILLKKLEFMHDYVRTNTCRSKFIRTYFGEKHVPGYCGICDNCTERTKKITNVVQTKNVRTIYNALKDRPLTNSQLEEQTGIKKNDLDQTLKMLLKEGIVSTNVSEVPVFFLSDS